MRKGLILLAIAATAVMFISGCVATGQAKASHIDIKGKTIAIKSGRWFEDCDKWESNDKINIAFSSSKPVKFSAHYRQKRSTETIAVVDEALADWYEGSIAVQGDEVCCFMWHNDNFEDITLTYDIGVGK
jgi:hypothetical protein